MVNDLLTQCIDRVENSIDIHLLTILNLLSYISKSFIIDKIYNVKIACRNNSIGGVVTIGIKMIHLMRIKKIYHRSEVKTNIETSNTLYYKINKKHNKEILT